MQVQVLSRALMASETLKPPLNFKERLPAMVASAKIEIIPSDKIFDRVDIIPRNSELSVTASPSKEIEETLVLSGRLIEKGFKVIPHIAARRIWNHNHLKTVAEFLDNHKISEIFVIGGDGEPFGDYQDSSKMLDDLLSMNRSVRSIGVGGYPEGHPLISNDALMAHLKAKIRIAGQHQVALHINSQACYDPEDITSWIGSLYKKDIRVPIYLGVSAPMNLLKLAQTSREIGVGDSVAFLKMVGIDSALKSAMYSPEPLLQSLIGKPESGMITGLHLFTFNHIRSSVDWQNNFKL